MSGIELSVDADALLAVSESLADSPSTLGRLRQAELRRAMSTAYYAMFFEIRANYADFLVGASQHARSSIAWDQAFRTLDHGPLASAAQKLQNLDMDPKLLAFFEAFAEAKQKREDADYSLAHDVDESDVLSSISTIAAALRTYRRVPVRDRRAGLAVILSRARQRR